MAKRLAAEEYREQNEVAARLILRDPARYAGLPLVWAREVLALDDSEAGPLFAKAA